jgi:zinc transporter, ZIP family
MSDQPAPTTKLRMVLLTLLPLAALGFMVWLFLAKGQSLTAPIRENVENLPLKEEIFFERVVFKDSQIVATVRNSGAGDITLTGIHINDMTTFGYVTPSNTIPRMGTATVTIPFDWIEGDPYEVRLVSSTGLFHATTIDLAASTPVPNAKFYGVFALLGLFVGVIPIYLGLTWFPVLRKLSGGAMNFLLAFTVGLLLFLGVDSFDEALELKEKVAGPFQSAMLILIASVGSFLLISFAGNWVAQRRERKEPSAQGMGKSIAVAVMIAIGIGIHNFGEGLSIGAAYTTGAASLGGLLVLGFTIHNTTEGIAIVAPLAKGGAKLMQLFWLGVVAGVPTVFGAWLGGFAYSPMWALVALAVGAGAIFQVVYVILKSQEEGPVDWLSRAPTFAGIMLGFALMYATGLMIA